MQTRSARAPINRITVVVVDTVVLDAVVAGVVTVVRVVDSPVVLVALEVGSLKVVDVTFESGGAKESPAELGTVCVDINTPDSVTVFAVLVAASVPDKRSVNVVNVVPEKRALHKTHTTLRSCGAHRQHEVCVVVTIAVRNLIV